MDEAIKDIKRLTIIKDFYEEVIQIASDEIEQLKLVVLAQEGIIQTADEIITAQLHQRNDLVDQINFRRAAASPGVN